MSQGIVSRPGRSGAFANPGLGEVLEIPGLNRVLLKYDSFGQPIYVKPSKYREILGEHKHANRRKRSGTKGKSKKR